MVAISKWRSVKCKQTIPALPPNLSHSPLTTNMSRNACDCQVCLGGSILVSSKMHLSKSNVKHSANRTMRRNFALE